MDAPQRRTAAFGRMETEKAMKEYTPSEKSTEELREYIVLPRYVAALGLCGVVV